jgi:hypothetical protein
MYGFLRRQKIYGTIAVPWGRIHEYEGITAHAEVEGYQKYEG